MSQRKRPASPHSPQQEEEDHCPRKVWGRGVVYQGFTVAWLSDCEGPSNQPIPVPLLAGQIEKDIPLAIPPPPTGQLAIQLSRAHSEVCPDEAIST